MRYRMVKMPENIYKKYFDVRLRMEKDLLSYTGIPKRLDMPIVFDAIISHNENFVQVDLNKLNDLLSLRKRGRKRSI